MAILNNGFMHSRLGTTYGNTLIDGEAIHCRFAHWSQSGRMDTRAMSSAYDGYIDVVSFPDDMNHPNVWRMAQVAGRMAAYNSVIGNGTLTPTMLLTVQAAASLIGSGDLAGAGGLIVNLLANLTGAGGISDADMKAFLALVASIGGAGGITGADATGIGALVAALLGDGTAADSLLTGTGAMTADIVVTGTGLSVVNVGKAVWSAVAADNNLAGTMGEKLNDAGSASNPWTEVIESGFTAAEILRLLAAASAGKMAVTGSTITFTGLDGTTDRIAATMSGGGRTSVNVDAT